MSTFSLKLKKGKELSLVRKHPWVFSGAIQQLPKGLGDGDIVDVYSYDQKYLGTGHYQGGGSISVRIVSFEQKDIDQSFWNQKIANAKKYRSCLNLPSDKTNTYRLLHGEGDGVPGLIIDIYNDIAVIQSHSIGVHKDADKIAKALIENFGSLINTIYLRCKDTLPEQYSLTVMDTFLLGEKEETIVSENNIQFKINVITGQKTGFFLDQRENRALLGKYAKNKTVLNCFCYTGGFSLYALAEGASVVDSVDISQKAVDLMDENVALNKHSEKHNSHCANVMQYLTNDDLPQYDIVVVDPPAFAKSLHKRHNAVQAYKRLNALAMKKVKSGGFLLTFSCSQVVGTQLFYDTIVAAGIEANKSVRVVQSLSQGPDHPIQLFHPEGHYLKGLVLYIE
jgi:23S rRNA (cytosine1962-C5)-methyltransferase